jgi:hypothetical protein
VPVEPRGVRAAARRLLARRHKATVRHVDQPDGDQSTHGLRSKRRGRTISVARSPESAAASGLSTGSNVREAAGSPATVLSMRRPIVLQHLVPSDSAGHAGDGRSRVDTVAP